MGDCILRQFAHMTTSGLKRDFTIAGLSYERLNESKNIMKNEGLNENYMLSMNIGCWYENGKHFDISIDVTLSKNENYAIYSSFGYDCDLLIINETMAEKLGFPVHGITGILLKNPNGVSSLTISDCFPNEDSTQVINLNKNRDSDQSQLLAILILASYIMLTTILLTCIIMSNTIRSNLLSRQSETAIMRAVGLTKKHNKISNKKNNHTMIAGKIID